MFLIEYLLEKKVYGLLIQNKNIWKSIYVLLLRHGSTIIMGDMSNLIIFL